MMDVFLLSFEARCILDGIRRGSEKTASSLSPHLPLYRSSAVQWRNACKCACVKEGERGTAQERECDVEKRTERLIEMDEGIRRER